MCESNVYTMESNGSPERRQEPEARQRKDNILETVGAGAGWIIGAGLTLGACAGSRNAATAARPLAKEAIKGYLALAERAKVAAAIIGEHAQDLYAEARAEYDMSCKEADDAVPKSPDSFLASGQDRVR
ncbi:MAG: DUF5132 domain-containing protein [Chloroflexi bacterium]|nr:DUF5132 domain-containing protein [Chloroflexota bacterium]